MANSKKSSTRKARVSRWLRYQYIRLVRINDTPPKIAAGVALGVFLGVFPTFGIGTLLAIVLAAVCRLNKVGALIGTLVMNPITTPFFWTGGAYLGAVLLSGDPAAALRAIQTFSTEVHLRHFLTWEGWRFLLAATGKGALTYLVGTTLLSLLTAALSYPLTLKILDLYRRRKALRRLRLSARP